MNNLDLNQKIINNIVRQLRINPLDEAQRKKPKNVLLISADYLPKDVSNVALQCKSLADGLAERGINVHVISVDDWKAGTTVEMGAVKVHYVGNTIKAYSPLTWALTVGMDVCRVAADIYHNEGNIDLIHAHDWMMFPTGINLQFALKRPLIVNYYSLQHHRTPGVSNGFTEAVKQIEWRGSTESRRILVNEDWMKRELMNYYSPPKDKVNVIGPQAEDWTKDIVRDYSWVLKNWWGEEENIDTKGGNPK
ncbi:Glycosyltransferase Family 4 [uncultured archaeon]|nr:Glycosyltransferase Family 4 [uncultured archaeon]